MNKKKVKERINCLESLEVEKNMKARFQERGKELINGDVPIYGMLLNTIF